MDPLKGK